MIWSISLFETVSVIPNPNIFFWIADTTANPNDLKMLLANGFSTFLSKDKPVLNNGPETLPRNSPNYIIIDSWVFKNFTLFDEALQNLSKFFKLVYQLTIIYVENWSHQWNYQSYLIKDTRVPFFTFFITLFNLLSCELDFKEFFVSFSVNVTVKHNKCF